MAEEIDESGFYREDFSTESDWEVFNSQLGDLFQMWDFAEANWGSELADGELYRSEWDVQSESLELLQKEISVSYYKRRTSETEQADDAVAQVVPPVHVDLMSSRNSFGSPAASHKDLHTLARLYGLRRFALLRPGHNKGHFLSNPAEFSFFLSAATVVAAEVGSTVPIFVQIYDPKWNFFVGVSFAPTMRTNFDLVSLDKSPADCRYLSGLLGIFKQKYATTYLQPANVAVQNTYVVDAASVRFSMHVPFAVAPTAEEDRASGAAVLNVSQIIDLPYGYFPHSSTNMYLTCTWPQIAENLAMDSALHSDFVPMKAPHVSVRQEVHATSYLSSCLLDYEKLCSALESLESFVGRNFSLTESGAGDDAHPLKRLTQSQFPQFRQRRRKYAFEEIRQNRKVHLPGPMNEFELNRMVNYLFENSYRQQAKANEQECDPQRIKSACPESLVCRFSCLLATCNAHFGGKSGLAQLWAAFVRELRIFWDYCLPVPGVAAGFPDMRSCLLHQKLQMLNVCVQRRELREAEVNPDTPRQTLDKASSGEEDNEDEEDEFYDCSNDEASTSDDASRTAQNPQGRLKRLGDLTLLDHVEEPLYVPQTQEPVPKTEDQLQHDADAMLKLGPGSGLTTQMMCSSLRSDMEAFKAANPKAKMEDFIRWYSPKDWEETTNDDEDVQAPGTLSARMLTPGNTWQLVWNEARAVPVWRQKRLFDDTSEALKVLHYLETRNIGEIYELTVIPMLHSAALIQQDILESANVGDLFAMQVKQVFSDLCRLSRDMDVVGQNELGAITSSPSPAPIIEQIRTVEEQFYQYKCFERTILGEDPDLYDMKDDSRKAAAFKDIKRHFKKLLENGSCQVQLRPEGAMDSVASWLKTQLQESDLRELLISKDYVIRQSGATTTGGKGDQAGPQFLRAIVTGEKIRLCGAFTESTTFI